MDGWCEDITSADAFSDLPAAAKDYVHRIEEILGVTVGIVSIGPKRSQVLFVE